MGGRKWDEINPVKIKAMWFTSARVKNPHGYSLGDQKIPEASTCKYFGIVPRADVNWVDQVNYPPQKAWKAFHFVIRVLKKGNRNTKTLAYTSLVRPILEYRSACWDPCRGQINALHQEPKKAAQFTNPTKGSVWETLAQRGTIARKCALFKAYSGERAWKAIPDRLQRFC